MLTKPLSDAANALTALGSQRVWSVLVTVFGDLAQNEGDVIEGPVLSTLMADIGIRPEATRVALHRLRNDDWVASLKKGRTSQHSLTAHGRRESAAANPRIYSFPQQSPDKWQLVILENASTQTRTSMERLGFAPFMPRVYLGASNANAPHDAVVLMPEVVPTWLAAQFEPKGLLQDYAALHHALLSMRQALAVADLLTPRDTAVLRCLIVHSWRRLVLKHPDLPRALYSESWRGHECRVLVSDLLIKLPKPNLGQILLD
jgi:phenylacetic acid degradation operon negative regulatory protein|tara:strand:+ start:3124 stop:3903 length:780 start_codon:yes stop_codon:yes gene_type:complete